MQSNGCVVLGLSPLRRIKGEFRCNSLALFAAAVPMFQWPARQTITVRLAPAYRARFWSATYSGYPLQKVAAREMRVELHRRRQLAKIPHCACDPISQLPRQSLLVRRRDLSELARLVQALPLVFIRDCTVSLLVLEQTSFVVLWTLSPIRSS